MNALRSRLRYAAVLACVLVPRPGVASEYHGQVTFGGLPVSGAVITATQGEKKLVAISDAQGSYFFADLPDGTWKISVEMQLFTKLEQEVKIDATVAAGKWELELLPTDQILAQTRVIQAQPRVAPAIIAAAPGKGEPAKTASAPEAPRPQEENQPRPADGFLINGSVNNAATSQFSLAAAFGNSRNGSKSLYTGGLALILDNSALDARPFSLTNLESPKASYNRITGVFTLGGPLNIPHLLRHGPNFFIAYQWTREHNASIEAGLVPTLAERMGDLSGVVNSLGQPVTVVNPATGLPFAGNVPVSPQAAALLSLYPLPNLAGSSRYNYQVPILDSNHQDALQSRLYRNIGRKDNFDGGVAYQSIRESNINLFNFNDTNDILGLNANVNWNHRFSQRLFINSGFRLSRLRTLIVPNFQGHTNISGAAGITGNDQDPANWGPPTLNFASGISALSDENSAFNRNRTDAGTFSANWYRGKHNITAGAEFRRQEYNYFQQSNPRGTFSFNPAGNPFTTGNDFADFLIGIPATSQVAFGNADKYFRQSVYALYVTDDWRIRPELTINAGMRWEYGAPITELKGRLVNIDVAPGFAAVAPVLATQPKGTLSGLAYPTSLIQPDKAGFEPRVGISWRPIPGSTLVVRAGYGVYDDTSVYQATALALAQQAPLSKSLSVSNGPGCSLTLANGFIPCATTTADTFGVDPNFRVGYAQTWQLLAQRDLPSSLQGTLTYLGIKGTRGVQEFLPNTYPIGAVSPCPLCPSGFVYRTSNGNSTRESGQVQLRRRLRNGFTASIQYTYSKSIDDDAVLGGQGPVAVGAASNTPSNAVIAQDWRNLSGERGLSNFDQRHLLVASAQYTSGQGIGGGSLMEGWRGTLLKEWTVSTQIVTGSGLPETPVYFATVPGTGTTGSIRANFTGSPLDSAPAGLHLNPAAFSAPAAGQWGTARRNSITGPSQFSMNFALARTFRLKGRYSLDTRVDATNLLNHEVYTSYITTVNSTQFGLPAATNGQRTLLTTTRLRF